MLVYSGFSSVDLAIFPVIGFLSKRGAYHGREWLAESGLLNVSKGWPEEIRRFIESAEWTFAKTYAATWPHEYIVKDRGDRELFLKTVIQIRENGYEGRFYRTKITYFEQDGLVYWTMVPPAGDPKWYPPEKETIINRCIKEDTYEYREEKGTLPKQELS